jgi:hypothetical protein
MIPERIEYKEFVNADNKEFVDAIINAGNKIELNRYRPDAGIPNTKKWTCMPQGDMFTISFFEGNESIDYFTHEILHAYFLSSLGFADTKDFNGILQDDKYASLLLPLDLVGHINNIFAHEKFFDIYLDRNFTREKFTSDFNDIPVFYQDIIENEFDSFVPNSGIPCFISSFFSCVDCRNGNYDKEIEDHFDFLNSVNPELYQILSLAWERWIAENEVSRNRKIISDLILQIGQWYKNKIGGR